MKLMTELQQAFRAIRRADFLPADVQAMADIDAPLPIGYGATNSQPTTVRWMLEWLDPQPGDKVLDVGSGSGWTTALLACLVGPEGRVIAVEKVPELVRFGAANCKKLRIRNAEFYAAGAAFGLPELAPYDRILVSAAAREVPAELLDQLAVGGRMVIPVQDTIHVISKTGQTSYDTETYAGFAFVPLV